MTIAGELQAAIDQMVQRGKGILAADENQPIIAKRFAAIGVKATAENCRALLFTAPGINFFPSVWVLKKRRPTSAQQELLKRARLNGAAQRGEYLPTMEAPN